MNITITVPSGTSNRGDSNLLCLPANWFDIATFFTVNYLAHAVTVKARPGEQVPEMVPVAFMALIYPYSGVVRGNEAIVGNARWRKGNALQVCALNLEY